LLSSKIVIFSFPRAGTKLLADILQQQGYHNFGELFETFGTEIDNLDPPTAKRLTLEKQHKIFESTNSPSLVNEDLHSHSLLISNRVELYKKYRNIMPSTITVFLNNIEIYPELLSILGDRYFLCLRRRNLLDQIISRVITQIHKNYNGEIESTKIVIDTWRIDKFFFNIKKLERIQDFIVSEGKGQIVDFDKLITSTENLGFKYSVTSIDQHPNLWDLVINLDEVKSRFEYLEKLYQCTNS